MFETNNEMPFEELKYRVEVPNCIELLRERCMNAAEDKYGVPLPKTVSERLEKELNAINTNNYASHYLIGAMIADQSLAHGYPVSTRGLLGSSFVAHLCGISAVNPLQAHYRCPKCHRFELIEDKPVDYQIMGYDLPERNCPECGTMLKAEGANIEPDVLMGINLDKEPDIIINIAAEIRPTLIDFIKETFGADCVFRAGIKMNQKNGSIRRSVHPGGLFIVPKGIDISRITAIRADIPEDDFHLKVTEDDYHVIDGILKKYDFLTLKEISMLKRLEDITHFHSDQIRTNSKEVLDVFLNEGFSFLPERKSPDTVATQNKAVFMVQPNSFSDLVKLSAMMHGVGTWNNNGELLIKNGKRLCECIACRDDIMQDLLAAGLDREKAFEIMSHIRKGNGLTDGMEKEMLLSGVPEWYIASCKKIDYLFPRAHAVEYMLLYWKLAYYKLCYPGEYQKVIFEVEENFA